MRLSDFTLHESIFIDANIIGHTATCEPADLSRLCSAFLYRVELGKVAGITSTFALNEVPLALHFASFALGRQHLLLPTDALHLATCQHYNIRHIATTDPHFDAVPEIMVWNP